MLFQLNLLLLTITPLSLSYILPYSQDTCDWDVYECIIPYDIQSTYQFICYHNWNCPANFRCCRHRCFRHNICQPIRFLTAPPKPVTTQWDEHPGQCDILLSCGIALPRSFTERFMCFHDSDCPDHFKCCYIECYHHKVCQPAKNEWGFPLTTPSTNQSSTDSTTRDENEVPAEVITQEVVTKDTESEISLSTDEMVQSTDENEVPAEVITQEVVTKDTEWQISLSTDYTVQSTDENEVPAEENTQEVVTKDSEWEISLSTDDTVQSTDENEVPAEENTQEVVTKDSEWEISLNTDDTVQSTDEIEVPVDVEIEDMDTKDTKLVTTANTIQVFVPSTDDSEGTENTDTDEVIDTEKLFENVTTEYSNVLEDTVQVITELNTGSSILKTSPSGDNTESISTTEIVPKNTYLDENLKNTSFSIEPSDDEDDVEGSGTDVSVPQNKENKSLEDLPMESIKKMNDVKDGTEILNGTKSDTDAKKEEKVIKDEIKKIESSTANIPVTASNIDFILEGSGDDEVARKSMSVVTTEAISLSSDSLNEVKGIFDDDEDQWEGSGVN